MIVREIVPPTPVVAAVATAPPGTSIVIVGEVVYPEPASVRVTTPTTLSPILVVAAAETSIGLAILVVYYRIRGTISIEFLNKLRS